MEITSIIEVWKVFSWLPDFILKRVFSKRRLAELIHIDVKPRGESVRVDLGQPPNFDIWLQLINMTPFEVELDRAEFEINFSGIRVKYKHLKKVPMKAGEILDLYISDNIDGSLSGQLNRMAQSGNDSSISLYAVFNSRLHQFEKENLGLSQVNVKYRNLRELTGTNA